jgi:Ca2+-binding RTX toxin-like protein
MNMAIGATELQATNFGNIVNGSANNDRLLGANGNDTLNGLAGNDSLNGSSGNDSLNGGSGNDSLTGYSGNDTLNGSTGNDTMNGESGNDTYVFNRSFGKDTITDSSGASDRLVLSNISKLDARFAYTGQDLLVSYNGATASHIATLKNQNSSGNRVELIQAADGTQIDVNSIISLINTYATNQGVAVSSLGLNNTGFQTYLLSQLAWG